jgi:ABC-2 type transport system permease protein
MVIMKAKNKKQADLINLLLGLIIVVLVNVLSQYLFTRIDLTAEKRYTLSDGTKDLLEKLDDVIYFRVYLEGDFPQGAGDYKRLSDETRIMLDEFRVYGGNKIQYEFIDPNENPDEKARKEFHDQLEEKGLYARNETFSDDNSTGVFQKFFPWAIASYHQQETAVPLLGSSAPKNNEQALNHAVEGLEYELANAIRKLRMRTKPRVAITQGHGEPDTMQLADLIKGLREYYEVETVNFNNNLWAFRDTADSDSAIFNRYEAIIVAGPDSTFSPAELFVLDQYILYGGNALFLVEPVYTDMDSLSLTGMTLGLPRQLGVDELLFKYGIRLNTTLVEDYTCAPLGLPLNGRIVPFPWVYSPTITPQEQHPIVRNLDAIKFDFLSTLDTLETSNPIKKTILIRSSDHSRYMRTPTRISLRMATIKRDPRSFDKPHQPVAAMLEGSFDSYYKNKFLPDTLKKSKSIGFVDKSLRPSKIIVIADGDLACNPIYKGRALPLGLDRYNQQNPQFYANKTLLLNCMNYLTDDNGTGEKGLLSLRSRVVKLRLLDPNKLKNQRMKWQLINIISPIALIIIFGLISTWMRKRKYVDSSQLLWENYFIPSIRSIIISFVIAVCDYAFWHNKMKWFFIVFGISLILIRIIEIAIEKRKKNPLK